MIIQAIGLQGQSDQTSFEKNIQSFNDFNHDFNHNRNHNYNHNHLNLNGKAMSFRSNELTQGHSELVKKPLHIANPHIPLNYLMIRNDYNHD